MSLYEKIDQYKAILDEKRPFESPVLKQLQDYYRIGLTYSSNALEGNTLTISETKVLLEDGLTANGKPLKDTFEALGHARAYDFMFSLLRKHEITEQDTTMLHRLFYTGIDDSQAGQYRTEPVFITGSSFPVCEAGHIRAEMTGLFRWIDSERGRYHPVEFAAELHKRFVFIHPFIDGNGRVARLLMNAALIQDGYMIVTIPPVLRMEYIGLLEKAHTDATDFINFIAEQELESEKDMMRLLHLPRS